MNWKAEWIIDDTGRVRWHETFSISDQEMKVAYLNNVLVGFVIESSAVMGVKVGLA